MIQFTSHSTFLKRIHRGSLFLIYFLCCFGLLRSLCENDLGPEGGKAIAEALKVNQTLQNIKQEAKFGFSKFSHS
jgi:hypothetical protein